MLWLPFHPTPKKSGQNRTVNKAGRIVPTGLVQFHVRALRAVAGKPIPDISAPGEGPEWEVGILVCRKAAKKPRHKRNRRRGDSHNIAETIYDALEGVWYADDECVTAKHTFESLREDFDGVLIVGRTR